MLHQTAQSQTAPLTDKQERFIYEYLQDQNASAAVRRAGYSGRSAGAQAAIHEEMAALFAELRVTAQRLLRRRMLAAFFDPAMLMDAEGNFLPLKDLDPETRSILVINYDINPKGGITTRVRSPNSNAALSALEKGYARFMDLARWEPVPEEPEEEYMTTIPQAEPEMRAEPAPEPEPAYQETAPAAVEAAPVAAPTFTQRVAQWVTGPVAAPPAPEYAGTATDLLMRRTAPRDKVKVPVLV